MGTGCIATSWSVGLAAAGYNFRLPLASPSLLWRALLATKFNQRGWFHRRTLPYPQPPEDKSGFFTDDQVVGHRPVRQSALKVTIPEWLFDVDCPGRYVRYVNDVVHYVDRRRRRNSLCYQSRRHFLFSNDCPDTITSTLFKGRLTNLTSVHPLHSPLHPP
jgi:hypothetical protein